jgi:3-hydroxybutyryl-CoA dehydrogenase
VSDKPDKALVGVVGAGRMGMGLALAFAYSGHCAAVVDLVPRSEVDFARRCDAFNAGIRADLDFLARVEALPEDATPRVMERISIARHSMAGPTLAGAETIFEAVPEVAAAKAEALQTIGQCARADAVIASTTSTFSADQLAQSVSTPERFLNAHWLNPAHLMPLVELSPSERTAAEYIARMQALLRSIGKVPVVCKSSPGYIVPRIQALAMNEAARLVEEGVASAEDVDTAIRVGFGLRFAVLGLLEFIDWGGGDILYYASRNLAENVDARRFATPDVVTRNMEEGRRGLRDGQGFYDYRNQDIAQYRNDRLAALVALLRHRGLLPIAG